MPTNLTRWAKTFTGGTSGKYQTQLVGYLGRKVKSVSLFPFGFAANVPPDNLSLALAVQDSPDNRAHIPLDSKTWPELAEGETAFYHPASDSFVIWREGGNLEIMAAGAVDITSSGNVTVTTEADATVNAANITATATTAATVTAPAIALNGAVTISGALAVASLTIAGVPVSLIPKAAAANVVGN